jgi:hypothetical protein
MKTAILTVLLLVTATAVASPADCSPDRNAALRYWMAFASMENPPADQGLADRLEAVSEGREPWSEELDQVVEHNRVALEMMHRGSRLPFCDWGLEAEMLANAPIAHVARGRALARLNVLHGQRLLQAGEVTEAVDSWLAGVRFSRDLAAGGPWLSALVASAGLEVHFRALTEASEKGALDAGHRQAIERQLESMPEDGFDWSVAPFWEATTLSGLSAQIAGADDPVAMLADYLHGGHEAPTREVLADLLGLAPESLDDAATVRAALRRAQETAEQLRPLAVAAFQRPWAESTARVKEVDALAAGNPALARLWPRATRLNERRGWIVELRADLLEQVRAR